MQSKRRIFFVKRLSFTFVWNDSCARAWFSSRNRFGSLDWHLVPMMTLSWRRQRVASVFCLLAYLLGASGALPELCALAASLDTSHAPLIGVGGDGPVLVLRHQKNAVSATSPVTHRHGIVARYLCALAKENGAQRDHRLEFAPCTVSERPERAAKFSAPAIQVKSFDCPFHVGHASAETAVSRTRPDSLPRSDSLLSTRFTVLLV
jgi:hypothetical protein